MKKYIFFGLFIIIWTVCFAQEGDDEPYLSIADQEAILDKAADSIIEALVTAEYKQDSQSTSKYIVRIEVYSRMKTSHISVRDLSLESNFFSWMHDGRKQNGYGVFMYSATSNTSRIPKVPGVKTLYGKSFYSVEEAIMEIQTNGSDFNKLIRYKPVVNQMIERLRNWR